MKLPTINTLLFTNSTAAGTAIAEVDGYNHLTLNTAITTDAASGATVKFYGSNQKDMPDLGSAASATNHYFAVQVRNSEDNSVVNGNDGIVLGESASDLAGYTVQSDNLRWLGAIISGVSGTIDVSIFATKTEN